MSKRRIVGLLAIGFTMGLGAGILIFEHYSLTSDFPRVIALRGIVLECQSNSSCLLRLLDLYETAVNRHRSWLDASSFEWNQELVDINDRRYILYSRDVNQDADRFLALAAQLRKHGLKPSREDIELERKIARTRYVAPTAPED